MKPALSVATLLVLAANVPAVVGQENSSAGQAGFSVSAGQIAPDLLTTVTPAKVCRTGSNVCFEAPEKYVFEPKVVLVDPDGPLLLFMATASGGGSGASTALALLEARGERFDNLTPRISLSEQGEYSLWREPSVSDAPILVTADYVWDLEAGETHFSPHRFRIRAFVREGERRAAGSAGYVLRAEYVTAERYPSLDDVDGIEVLDNERTNVIARLQ